MPTTLSPTLIGDSALVATSNPLPLGEDVPRIMPVKSVPSKLPYS